MIENIETGKQIKVTIVKQPTNAAAVKTLQRVLSKDEQAKAEQKRLERARRRNLRHHQRGGRQWAVRVVKQQPVQATVGASGTIKATYDTIRDLESVERFVQVAPA